MPIQFDPRTNPPDGSWFDSLFWKSSPPNAGPLSNTIYARRSPEGGAMGRLPPPDIPQMPQVAQQPYDPLSSIQSPPQSSAAMAAPAVGSDTGVYGEMPPPANKYSFMDNPGASDAMVAFGAAMLKAPDFNSGLGDAALAVNQVAKQYRMPTEQDYARAKMLGMTARLARGYDAPGDSQPTASYGNQVMGYAPGPNGEMQPVPAYLDKHSGMIYQLPDGTRSTTPPPGWIKATDSGIGSYNSRSGKSDADAEQQLYDQAMAANDNIIQLDQLTTIAPTAGIGLDAKTRIARGIAQLTGGNVGSIDPTSISTLQSSTKQLGLNWSQKMKGQGQVTESERQLIADMLPQSLSDPATFNNLVSLLKKVEQRKQQMADEWFSNQAELRQKYGSFRGFMLTRVKQLEITAPTGGNGPDSAAPPANPELEDALKQYGG